MPRWGDYVMVHVGFAISKLDEQEDARTYYGSFTFPRGIAGIVALKPHLG